MSRIARRTVTGMAIAALALASTVGGASAQDQTLRVAMGSPGEAAIAVWDSSPRSTRRHIPAGRSR